jgi:hypothetical protein
MSFDDIVLWARDLGLESESDDQAYHYRFWGAPEVLHFEEPIAEIDTGWLSYLEARVFLLELENKLERQPQ